MPLEISRIIEISDPVYTLNEVLNHIDLKKYLAEERGRRTGRPGYDSEKLLRIVLFAFMENGYASVRQIEKLCKTDIRFMWLLDESPAPSFMTIDNFMNQKLVGTIEEIFIEINRYVSYSEYEASVQSFRLRA
jgi:transposase